MTTTTSLLVAIEAVASSVQTFLGGSRSSKCVVESGDQASESQLLHSTCSLLNALDLDDSPAAVLLRDAALGLDAHCGTGTTTFVTLCGLLAAATRRLLAVCHQEEEHTHTHTHTHTRTARSWCARVRGSERTCCGLT